MAKIACMTDVKSLGGEVGIVSLGKVSDAVNPELIGVPYLIGPKVLKMGTENNPLFMTSLVDYYRTASSGLYFTGGETRAEFIVTEALIMCPKQMV